jgi:hypothetical protein
MVASERHPGVFTKVPRMRGDLCRDWDRSGSFGVNRDVPADATGDPLRGVAVIPRSKKRVALDRVHIHNERKSRNQNERPLNGFVISDLMIS